MAGMDAACAAAMNAAMLPEAPVLKLHDFN
jgi:hypothetical protein